MPMREDIGVRFTYHPPKDGQVEKYNRIRAEAKALALTIDELCPMGRETDRAFDKLQEAVMWANASIAMRTPETTTVVAGESVPGQHFEEPAQDITFADKDGKTTAIYILDGRNVDRETWERAWLGKR